MILDSFSSRRRKSQGTKKNLIDEDKENQSDIFACLPILPFLLSEKLGLPKFLFPDPTLFSLLVFSRGY
ncbi:hypothetical protein L3X38_038434 [Prunus dulcis]|uniref:Uncharacterized protein n=1 Tax=Prunus dulcis TaxID=3755 RepID=A0AAD4YRG7_PRUDU|nr:hypothetical protein L3X38_038434 [Prunus dulcis]